MSNQRILFEQGSTATGDSGERGDSTSPDGGFESIKPYNDGEGAAQSVFRRPPENLRKRTERLREAGEEAKYFADAGMRWVMVGGNAEGLSAGPEPMPGITGWDPSGGAGSFLSIAPMVVQPLSTPSVDRQEEVVYPFNSVAATVMFQPIAAADPPVSGVKQKRAYNGANLIRVIWEEKTALELAGAIITGVCDVVISGDPEHILTISILDTGATQIQHLISALAAIETSPNNLETIGLTYTIAGITTTAMPLAEVAATVYGVDYRMRGTFEREIHYIPTATFVDFFASNELLDGDTLAIHFEDYATDADAADPLTGRRERVPSNNTTSYPNNTTVLAADLFITSTLEDVYKIPLCIPLCKRIGDDLYWLDGTMIMGTQTGEPIYMGEHGYTVNRIVGAASTVLLTAYNDPAPESQNFMGLTNISIQDNMENAVRFINSKGSLDQDEEVTGSWWFQSMLHVGNVFTTSALLSVENNAWSVSTADGRAKYTALTVVGSALSTNDAIANWTRVDIAASGNTFDDVYMDYGLMYATLGTIAKLTGRYNQVWLNGATVTGVSKASEDSLSTAAVGSYDEMIGSIHKVVVGHDIADSVKTCYNQLSISGANVASFAMNCSNVTTLTSGTVIVDDLYGTSEVVQLFSGSAVTNEVYGHYTSVTLANGFSHASALYGDHVLIDAASGSVHTLNIYGFNADILLGGEATNVAGIDVAITGAATADLSGIVKALAGTIVLDGSTVLTGNLLGLSVVINSAADSSYVGDHVGGVINFYNSGDLTGGNQEGLKVITYNAGVSDGDLKGIISRVSNAGGTVDNLYGVQVEAYDLGTVGGESHLVNILDNNGVADNAVCIRSGPRSTNQLLAMETYANATAADTNEIALRHSAGSMGNITAPTSGTLGKITFEAGNAGAWSKAATIGVLYTGAAGSFGTPATFYVELYPQGGDSFRAVSFAPQAASTDIWIGVSTTTPTIACDLTNAGGIAVRPVTLVPASSMDVSNRSLIRLNGAGPVTITTLTGGVAGQMITIYNDTATNITLSGADNINMGISAPYVCVDQRAILLVRGVTDDWFVVGM